MTQPLFDNLDHNLLYPADRTVPDGRDNWGEYDWNRNMVNIEVDWERVGQIDWEALSG